MAITCTDPTTHYPSGRALLIYYDFEPVDGIIGKDEHAQAIIDYLWDKIDKDEAVWVTRCYEDYAGVINDMCAPAEGRTIFYNIGEKFKALANYPVIGSIFAAIGAFFYTADDLIIAFRDAIDTFLDAAGIKALVEETYDIVAHTWSEVTDVIAAAIDDLQDWTKKTFSDATDDFIDAFQNKFAASEERAVAFLTALGIGAGDVILTILDTPGEMFLWIRAEIENAYDIVSHAWSDVTDAIFTAIDGLSDIVDHTWSEVTEYADAKIAALSDIVDHTWSEVTEYADAKIDALSDIVDHTWSEVTEYADAKIAALSDIVDHTWSEVTGYVDSKIAALSDIVDHTWSEVTGAVDTATEGLKTWFGEQEEMVYGWISEKWVDRILDLVDSNVDKFKDKIWNLVEKIVEKI